MSTSLRSLPPVVRGASYWRAAQGRHPDGTAPTATNPSGFLAADALVATVGPAGGSAATVAPAAAWIDPALATFALSLHPAQSALLDPSVTYVLEVFVARGGEAFPLLVAELPVLPNAGLVIPAPPATP